MDTSSDAGGFDNEAFIVLDFNLQREKLASDLWRLANFKPKAFTALVEEISQGNIAVKNTVLRRWGVRRC